jgi:hypothetical protein
MAAGQLVTVKLYGGKTASRRLLAIKNNVVVICAEEEYLAAKTEGREPEGLGFPSSDVMGLPDQELVHAG